MGGGGEMGEKMKGGEGNTFEQSSSWCVSLMCSWCVLRAVCVLVHVCILVYVYHTLSM